MKASSVTAAPQAVGEAIEVCPGILTLRLPLPFALDHVNVYLLDDGDGWLLLDAGYGDARNRTIWDSLAGTLLDRKPITRILLTHHHPDHIGQAGYLAERFGAAFLTSAGEYRAALDLVRRSSETPSEAQRTYYRRAGVDAATLEIMLGRPYNYAAQITGLPEKVETVSAGSTLSVGGRRSHVLTGGGHSVEQVLLWCPDDEILFCADQVLARISPHVGVWAGEGVAEPLSLYLASLDRMKQAIPPSAFALPGHGPPISDLHARVDEIIAHHRQRCEIIVRACEQEARTSFGLLPLMFSREFRPGELGFALSEAVAHVNHLVEHGAIAGEMGPDGAVRFRAC